MSVTLNSRTAIQKSDGSVDPTTFSFSANLNAGSNRGVEVNANAEADTGSPLVSGVTFGGVAMTLVGSIEVGSGFKNYSGKFILLESDLPSDGSKTVVVTWTGNISTSVIFAECVIWNGVEQVIPSGTQVDTQSGQDVSSLVFTPTTDGANSLVSGTLSAGASITFTPPTGYTENYDTTQGSAASTGWDKIESSASTLLSLTATASVSTNRLTGVSASWNEAAVSGVSIPVIMNQLRNQGIS